MRNTTGRTSVVFRFLKVFTVDAGKQDSYSAGAHFAVLSGVTGESSTPSFFFLYAVFFEN
jgi:hypothetical protein